MATADQVRKRVEENAQAQGGEGVGSQPNQSQPDAQTLPPTSKTALRFIRRAHANPHFRDVMKDLAEK